MNLISKENSKIRRLVKETPAQKEANSSKISTIIETTQVEDQNDFDKMKSTLEELLASFREMQQDIYFIKTRYVKPVKAIKTKVSKEQRKTMIINKMLTRGKRID